MDQPKSSSNRETTISDAVLWKNQRPLGPMRLPENRAAEFVADFNRIYRGLGMSLRPVDRPNKKISGSSETAGDSSLNDRPKESAD